MVLIKYRLNNIYAQNIKTDIVKMFVRRNYISQNLYRRDVTDLSRAVALSSRR